MINSFAIVITTHKRVLNDFELKNLKIISYHHPSIEKFIVLPQTLDTFFYRKRPEAREETRDQKKNLCWTKTHYLIKNKRYKKMIYNE
jgi:hypothetical protein